jgi:ATP-dependent helicase HrpA
VRVAPADPSVLATVPGTQAPGPVIIDPALAAQIAALPVVARREEIVAAIRANPVVIVSGETGSGKTTQLPKFCLAAGRGRRDPATGRGGIVGHTQPRRIAATTVAQRIATELGTPLGVEVGYRIRFGERVSPSLRIKLMTDGILLAESQSDPLLARYDTILIDEAHERSLNIDFLIGYLKRLLEGPRRHDLKLIITSATIDAARFAAHFAFDGEPAPVIEVSGRLYPVEIRYRPPGTRDDRGSGPDADEDIDLPIAIADALAECRRAGPGDALVFLPGEREIRDCAAHLLREIRAHRMAPAEILMLYARLSSADQQRVFEPGAGTRIVLATNVAETSLTVPRIRYVIDSGLARVKRYRLRAKVEQLLVEPIAQAAADQRAGRCGRVADGLCVRLYDEAGFARRPRFSDPEILRSSLAGVLLRMRSLGFEAADRFPFLDPPSNRAIADGHALLTELGAIDREQALTPIGRALARFPVDPRTARMLLAARDGGCLAEALVIAAALSTQDPRERPQTAAQAADQSHARFADGDSDFVAALTLWRYWQQQVSGRGARAESQRALAQRLGREFLSVRRLREWADVHRQLRDLAREAGWKGIDDGPTAPARNAANATNAAKAAKTAKAARTAKVAPRAPGAQAVPAANPPSPAPVAANGVATVDVGVRRALHRALLTGLLGNVGVRAPDGAHYLGTFQQKFLIHPSSALGRRRTVRETSTGDAGDRPGGAEASGAGIGAGASTVGGAGRWVMAAEMVDTGRLYARTVARIDPKWVEAAAGHLLERTRSDPRWDPRSGRVVASERASLYGLTIYSGRRVAFDAIDAAEARRTLIRDGLVAGNWPGDPPFIRHNRRVIEEIERLEHRTRRPDLLVDDEALFAWFDARVPPAVTSARQLEDWLATQRDRHVLDLSREALLRREADDAGSDRFPRELEMNGVRFALDYRFEPGSADDGVTLTVPLYAVNQVDARRLDWLVPGLLPAKVDALLRTLPQRARGRAQPLTEVVDGFVADHLGSSGSSAASSTGRRASPMGLIDALIADLRRRRALTVLPGDFRPEALPDHLRMNLRVVDEHGRQLGQSRQLARLQSDLGLEVKGSFQAALARVSERFTVRAGAPSGAATAASDRTASAAPAAAPFGTAAADTDRLTCAEPKNAADGSARVIAAGSAADAPDGVALAVGQRFVDWRFGTLPEIVEFETGEGATLVGYPALADRGDSVELRLHDVPEAAEREHRAGVARLFAIALAEPLRQFQRDVLRDSSLQLRIASLPNQEDAEPIAEQVVAAAIERAAMADGLPVDASSFKQAVAAARPRITLLAGERLRLVRTIADEYGQVRRALAQAKGFTAVVADVTAQLQGLMPPSFVRSTPFDHLTHLPRYLRAIVVRLDKLRSQPDQDQRRMAQVVALAARWQRRRRALQGARDPVVEEFRWMLEELRVSLFAQTLRTPFPVSVKRLERILDQHEA